VLNGPVVNTMLQMNNPVSGGVATLPYGGSELSLLLTFQLPLLSVSMSSNLPGSLQLLSTTSLLNADSNTYFMMTLSASLTGGNSGTVSASFTYSTIANGNTTQLTTPTQLMVAMPMLVGGWVTTAFSLTAAGVATLSVRDIFAANNVTSTSAHLW